MGKKFINSVRLCSHLANVKETDMKIFGNNSLTIGLKHLQDIIANLTEGLKTN